MTSYQESDAASRQDESKSALGCLIPLIASTVLLAIGITLVSWFVIDDEEQASQPAETASAEPDQPVEVYPDDDAAPSARQIFDRFARRKQSVSSEALLEVVRSSGWKEFGKPEVIDLGSQQRVARKFRRNREHIKLTIHSYNRKRSASRLLEETDLPARAIQFDNKVVVIEPITVDSKKLIAPLADRLRKFRDLLEEKEASP